MCGRLSLRVGPSDGPIYVREVRGSLQVPLTNSVRGLDAGRIALISSPGVDPPKDVTGDR